MHMNCPCGVFIEADDEDSLVEAARAHLEEKHPGRDYSREQILFFADA